PPHVASRGRRRDSGAEGHVLGESETETERAGHLDAVEVLLEVPQDVRVIVAGGKDVDEAEELGLEARMRHGPLEEPLAPPAEVVGASTGGKQVRIWWLCRTMWGRSLSAGPSSGQCERSGSGLRVYPRPVRAAPDHVH